MRVEALKSQIEADLHLAKKLARDYPETFVEGKKLSQVVSALENALRLVNEVLTPKTAEERRQ
ncbi:MAG: hypothetical protein QXV01_10670 [Candidatus Bathyarchaeia archaeon]|nr:hypothetical protein [Candidatus Bathyarchaeota archaeon]